MFRKTGIRYSVIGVLVILMASFFAFSLSVCDDKDAEGGALALANLFALPSDSYVPRDYLTPLKQFAFDFEVSLPHSAILYLELHETSPPNVTL